MSVCGGVQASQGRLHRHCKAVWPEVQDILHFIQVQCIHLVLYLGRQDPLSRPWEEAFFTPSTTGGPPSGGTPPGPRLFIYFKNCANKPSILDMMHSFQVQCIHSTLDLARKVSLTGPWEAFNAFIPPFRTRPVSINRADPGAHPVIQEYVIGKIFHDGYNLYRFNDEYIFIQIILIGYISYLIGQILHEYEQDWHHQIPALRSSMDGDGRIFTKSSSIFGCFWTQTRILDARNLSWVLIVGACVGDFGYKTQQYLG